MKLGPLCRWCAKPLRKEGRTVWIETKPHPSHRETEWARYIVMAPEQRPRTMADCRRLTNQTVISLRKSHVTVNGDRTGEFYVRSFTEWDGESYYSRHRFFCSTTCAMLLGEAAASHSRGFASVKYHDTIAARAGVAS